jgi:hypothetical protein
MSPVRFTSSLYRFAFFTFLRHAQTMKLLLLSLLLLAWSSAPALAQKAGNASDGSVPPAVSATIEQITPGRADPIFTVTTIDRFQSLSGQNASPAWLNESTNLGNDASISQIGDENLTVLRQFGGAGNVASISILGNDNRVSATQRGTNNRLGITAEGNSNVVPVTQIGEGNELSLKLFGSGLRLDQQVLGDGQVPGNGRVLGNGAPLNTGGIVQEGTGTIPLHIQIRPGN